MASVTLAIAVKLLVALIHNLLGSDAPAPVPVRRRVGGAVAGAGTFYPGLGEGGGVP